MSKVDAKLYGSFTEFYPFYLGEHRNAICRRMHFVGSTLVILAFVEAALSGDWRWLPPIPLLGYGFAWIGHFFFEKNKPATFRYPLYSLIGDWTMYRDMLTGKVSF